MLTSQAVLQVVISQAGANDFAAGRPDQEAFVAAYLDLLQEVGSDNASAVHLMGFIGFQ